MQVLKLSESLDSTERNPSEVEEEGLLSSERDLDNEENF
jgi:hypothetical protein